MKEEQGNDRKGKEESMKDRRIKGRKKGMENGLRNVGRSMRRGKGH